MNIDIDTQQAKPALIIRDDKHLCDLVYDLATRQLLINAAEAELQAKIEAAKKAFTDATRENAEIIRTNFAAVEAYATEHKDRLFPVKAGKRKKTFNVLQHKLQYRSSDQVKAPANAAEIIRRIIAASEVNILNLGDCESSHEIAAMITKLQGLIRQPEPELNKDAVKAATDAALLDLLASHGITVETLETFKLSFAFTPDQEATGA